MRIITIYKVTATSLDDGHRLTYGNYRSHENASSACARIPESMDASVIRSEVIELDNGALVEIPSTTIKLMDDKETILNKLSVEARRVLGV
jgi:hypothetical protein